MNPIVVIGSSNTDMVVRVPRIPRPGETVLGKDFLMNPGGKGANQAVAASRAGGRVSLVARLGDDIFGRQAIENFLRDGIDVRFVRRSPGTPSGVALINVDGSGENSISVAPGANALLSVSDVEAADELLSTAGILLLQLETPLEAVVAAARMARSRGVPVILNPAPASRLSGDVLGLVSVLTPNESEAASLTGLPLENERTAERAAGRLRRSGVRAVVITMGERGAYVSSDEFSGLIPSFKVEPVDTTAAGDVFNGTLAVGLAEKKSLAESLRFAMAAAALSVTKPGAQASAPRRWAIEEFLAAGQSL